MTALLKELYDSLRMSQGGRAVSSSDDPLVLQLSQLVLSHGLQSRASDIHIEPTLSGARIRYRIDGILHEVLQVPQEIRDPLIRSIKVKANMATENIGRSKPQDSRIDFEMDGHKIDLRLSSFPTLFGDVLAMRLLSHTAAPLTFDQIGFAPETLEQFERLIRRPNGFILVTGPTNTGKTTTLYAAIHRLRSPHTKIITLEDPVEYQLDGVIQGQINPTIGLTFSSGLRAILRQDANVILVGEIRDTETVDVAIRAALTGHLVFSTMHTRHSLGAITRLLDMKIEPHLIVASVTGIVAQRLVRVLCPQCQTADPIAASAFTRLWTQETGAAPLAESLSRLRKGIGCPACNATGYQGRVGIFELLILTDAVKRAILNQPAGGLYQAVVASGGLQTMLLDGLRKAARGQTSVDEVLRVTGETEGL